MLLPLVLTLAAVAPPRHLARACTTSQTVGNVGEAIMHNLGEEHVNEINKYVLQTYSRHFVIKYVLLQPRG